jgi:hypothetical protein
MNKKAVAKAASGINLHADDGVPTSTLQFPQPLMGYIEVSSYWRSVDAARLITLLSNARDAASKYGLYALLWS